MTSFNLSFMMLAIEEAKKAGSNGEVPVGAVLVHNQSAKVILSAHNQVEQIKNPLMHAEMLVIQNALASTQTKYLNDYDLYVTLEPCAMCASAISHARVGRLFYAAADPKFGAIESGVKLYSGRNCNHKPEIYSDIMREESEDILKSFFQNLRN